MSKTAPEFETIQESMKSVVGAKNDSGLSVEEWGYRLDHAVSTMYAKGGAVPFTLDDLVKITAHGFLRPLKWLAHVGKAVVFELPKLISPKDIVISKVADSAIKFGKFLQTYSNAQHPESEGGAEITATEAAGIKGRALDLISILAAIVEAMDEIINKAKK